MVKVISQKGCIAAAHGRLDHVRQVAPMCTPSNTCFLGATGVHIPNGISIGSAIFSQLTTESTHTLQWAAISPLKWAATPAQNCLFA